MSLNTNTLIIAQLALGDSVILIRQFIKKIEGTTNITVLCNSYNYFLFSEYDCLIEDWPISRRKIEKIPFSFSAKNFDYIVLPSGHLREKIFARFRFINKKLYIPIYKNFKKLQRSNFYYLVNIKKIRLHNPNNWYEMYEQAANIFLKILGLSYERKINKDEHNEKNQYINGAIICPHSRGSGSYKNIPDELLEHIIEALEPKCQNIYVVSERSEFITKKDFSDKITYYSPQKAFIKFSKRSFKYGVFTDSFFNHFMYGKIKNHYTFFTKIDPYHAIAAPPLIKPFYGLDDINF